MNGIFDGKSLDYWFNQMYYGTHGPFKRAEAGQAITFENDKVRFEQCFSILLILRRPIGQKFLPMHCSISTYIRSLQPLYFRCIATSLAIWNKYQRLFSKWSKFAMLSILNCGSCVQVLEKSEKLFWVNKNETDTYFHNFCIAGTRRY